MSKVTPNTHQAPGSTRPSHTTTPPNPVHRFTFSGRRFRLTKRRPEREAPWYLVSEINRRRFNHSLGSNVAEVAARTAIAKYIEPALSGRWGEVEAVGIKSREVLTVAELLAAWRSIPGERSTGHVEGCANAFLSVARRAGVVDALRCRVAEVVTADLVERWRSAVLQECAGLDQAGASRIKRSQNSVLVKAKCLFSSGALGDYGAAGIAVPEVAEFLTACQRRRFQRVSKEEAPASREQMRGLVRMAAAAADWNEFAAVFLSLAFGLRKGEVSQVSWGDLRVIDGAWWLDASARVKRGSGRLVVRALDPFWRVFVRRARRAGLWGGSGLVLQGSRTEREDLAFRRVGEWMRSAGWGRQKTNHAWRAFVGGEVARRWGVYEAQAWLRHRSVTTTEANYTRQFLSTGGPVPLIRWASA